MTKKIVISTLIISVFFFFSFLQYQKMRGLRTSIVQLESRITDLESNKTEFESRIDDLESRIDDLESHYLYR